MDLSSIPVVDQHAHNLLLPEAAARVPFRSAFTEAYDPVVLNEQCTGTLYFRRSLRDIGELLDCPPTEEAILARRPELGEIALAERCFRASNLEMVLMEDGFLPGQIRPIEWHAQFFPVRRLVRLETVAEELLGSARSFEDHVDRFRAAIEPASSRAVGFKTIIAYRTGLDVGPVNAEAARAAWGGWKAAQGSLPRPRLTDKALLDFLLEQGLEVAARHRLPLQIHTGFGDPDLDLRLANPLHLRRLLEDPRFKTAAFVLLHAS